MGKLNEEAFGNEYESKEQFPFFKMICQLLINLNVDDKNHVKNWK